MEKFCQNCQQSNPPDALFCRNCAATLSGGNSPRQPNSGASAGQNFAPTSTNSGAASQRATAALILAIAGLFCCGPLTSIPAIVVGWMEVAAIKQGQSSTAGMIFAQIGLWGGIAVTILQAAAFLLWILISMATASSNPY